VFAYGEPVWQSSSPGFVSFSPGPPPKDAQLEQTLNTGLQEIEEFRDEILSTLAVLRIAGDRLRSEFVDVHTPVGTQINTVLRRSASPSI
jgi:hypothetical protein